MPNKIWIVSYINYLLREPIVTAFNNQTAAEACYNNFKHRFDRVCIDECDIYSSFSEISLDEKYVCS